jgi:hypothetical protein
LDKKCLGPPPPAPTPAASNKKYVKAQYEYDSGDPDDLAFVAGDILEVVDDSDPDWLKCKPEKGGKVGAVPSNFVAPFTHPKPVAAPAIVKTAPPPAAVSVPKIGGPPPRGKFT